MVVLLLKPIKCDSLPLYFTNILYKLHLGIFVHAKSTVRPARDVSLRRYSSNMKGMPVVRALLATKYYIDVIVLPIYMRIVRYITPTLCYLDSIGARRSNGICYTLLCWELTKISTQLFLKRAMDDVYVRGSPAIRQVAAALMWTS